MHRVRTTLVTLGAAGLVLAACGSESVGEKVAEKAIEQSAGGDADVEVGDDGSFSFESDDGSVSVDEDGNVKIEGQDGSYSLDSQSGELPDDFPDVPLPDGFEVQSSATQNSGDEVVHNVGGTVDGDPADVYEALLEQYGDAGFSIENQFESNSSGQFSGGATASDSSYTVNMSVTTNPAGDGAYVNILVTAASE